MPHSGPPLESLRRWLLFGLFTSNNPGLRRKLTAHYGSAEKAVRASESGWRRDGLLRPGRGRGIFGPARGGRCPEVTWLVDDTGAWLDRQLETAGRLGAGLLHLGGPGYPGLLEKIPDPPAVIYLRGRAELLDRPSVALVGARRASPYGLAMARSLAGGLGRAGVAVVSGGARGIDTESHVGALESGGPTIAVMGAGLDVVYPPENRRLFDEVAEAGVLISEFPFGSQPLPHHFPIRNRTIAGLSLAVTVIEGKAGSGSLITAECALESGRDVLAVPGPVTSPLSEGPNGLIRAGAALIRSSEDILDEVRSPARLLQGATLEEVYRKPGEPAPGIEDGPRRVVFEALKAEEARSIDQISGATGLPSGAIMGALTELELQGCVRKLPGGRFARRQ